MDKIVVVGLLVVASIVSAMLVFNTIIPSLTSGGEAVAASRLDDLTRQQTAIKIVSVMPRRDSVPPPPTAPLCPGDTIGCSVDAWAKNVGGLDIASFANVDVILSRTDGRWARYIPYSSNCPASLAIADTWHRFPCGEDRWPVSDILPIRVNLLADPLPPGIYELSITTPNGVTSRRVFEFAPPQLPIN